jgi:putative ABC transport system ATP-binding protein
MAVELNLVEHLVAAGVGREAVVSAAGVTRRYGQEGMGVDALRGVSLAVAPGEVVAVMGPSGSGKSTLLHILAGLDRPTSGEAFIDGVALSTMPDQQLTLLRRHKVGFVFQFFNLLPMLSAEQNIVLPLKLAGETPDGEWVDQVIESVGLGARRAHRPAELSGGQQQRVAIARALITRPSVLFADEPTGNLDSNTSQDVLELLRDSVDELRQTIVMVTHDPQAAAQADRILFLADGRIVKEIGSSTAAQVLAAMQEVSGR